MLTNEYADHCGSVMVNKSEIAGQQWEWQLNDIVRHLKDIFFPRSSFLLESNISRILIVKMRGSIEREHENRKKQMKISVLRL